MVEMLKDQVSDLEERIGSIRSDLAQSKKREAQLQVLVFVVICSNFGFACDLFDPSLALI